MRNTVSRLLSASACVMPALVTLSAIRPPWIGAGQAQPPSIPEEHRSAHPSQEFEAAVEQLFSGWPESVMTCQIADPPTAETDPKSTPRNSDSTGGNKRVPTRIRYTVSVDIGIDEDKWRSWSLTAATVLKGISVRSATSSWPITQTTAPRIDEKSEIWIEFLDTRGKDMSPAVRKLEHRLFRGVVHRPDTANKEKRRTGEKPRLTPVVIDAIAALETKVEGFARWKKDVPREEHQVCVSIQADDKSTVQHFLLPADVHPDFAGLAGNDRIPVVELILKDENGNRLPILWGDKQTPMFYTTTNLLMDDADRWYFASPRFLLQSYPMVRWTVSSPAITFRFEFELDQETAVRLATAEAKLISGEMQLGPPGPTGIVPPAAPSSAPQLPNATPPGLSPPPVPRTPAGPRMPRLPSPPPVPRG
jgi:hypothetical protein